MINNYTRSNNPINVVRNTSGRERIFIDVRQNPQRIFLNSDAPGDALMVRITYVAMDISSSPNPSYIQIDMGDSVRKELTQVFGGLTTCIQVPYADNQTINRVKIPIRFHNNHIPQNFMVTIYGPGEPARLLQLGPNGVQIWMEYEFIST